MLALAFPDPRDGDSFDYLEEWIDAFGHLGIAARLAIPRLTEFLKHPDPWVHVGSRGARRSYRLRRRCGAAIPVMLLPSNHIAPARCAWPARSICRP